MQSASDGVHCWKYPILVGRKIRPMPINRNLLIVIADGEHASFFRPAPHNAIHRDESFDSINAHKRSADLGSDRPGGGFHTGASAHHALAPQHDPHTLEKEKFGRLVAQQLNEAA